MPGVDEVLSEHGEGRVLVVSEAATDVERDAVLEALADRAAVVELVDARDDELVDRLDGDDAAVVPVRVVWLPGERDGERRASLRDILTLEDPRRPRARSQSRIAERAPDRRQVVAGEPARVHELRRRWTEDTGGEGGRESFAEYVRRQASLALERAERPLLGDRYKVPRLVVEEIAESARFREEVAELALRLERPTEEVMEEAVEALDEVVAAQSRLAMDAFDLITRPLFERAWEIDVDRSSLERLRELNRTRGLIFLPAHRSYVDPLVLGRVLDEAGFPRNHTPGGENLRFWPLAPIARRAGIIFIPRSLRGKEVKKFVLREYLGFLAAKRFNLEWYMEAGRSRTGKLRPPKFGLLQFIVDALRSGRVDDVALVPVSITYDRLPEVGTMAEEEMGAPKSPEGLRWLARYARGNVTQGLGTVYVRFGEPVSLREGLDTAESRGADEQLAMQKVGFEVFHRINAVTPITPMSLVTLALLGVDGRALTLDEVIDELAPFLEYIDERRLPLTDRDGVTDRIGLRGTLQRLESAGIVSRYDRGTTVVHAIEPGQHHAAAFYRNSSIHWFVNRAIIEVAIAMTAEDPGEDPVETAWQHCLRLRDLLKFEFFFSDKRRFLQLLLRERELMGIDDDTEVPDGPAAAEAVLEQVGFLAAPIVLRPFLEAFSVVADRLAARDPRRPIVEKEFVAECADVGRQYLLQHRLRNPESVSPELFSSALRLVENRDLFDPGREGVAVMRLAFADEIRRVLAGLDEVERIADRRRAAALGDG